MASTRITRLKRNVQAILQNNAQREGLLHAVLRGREGRRKALAALPDNGQSLRKQTRTVKVHAQTHLDQLIDTFMQNARKRGVHVYLARDGHEATAIIVQILYRHRARLVLKSKSLTSEEIELNHPLEEAGFQVVETDLGELIIQLAQEKPYHLVFPAVHHTASEVARLFEQVMEGPIPEEPQDIMDRVRAFLRPIFLQGEVGITGANVAIAKTGGILIETNEGNGRLVSSIPPVHIVLFGIEKLVERLEDAFALIRAHPLFAVGQPLTTYVSWLHGKNPDGQGPREAHYILLDNGRQRMRQDPVLSDALNCIRCGACMNGCPTYGVTGGHVFGHIYPGPMGIPWTAGVHGLDYAAAFAPLCISCGVCKEYCPADIDLPFLIAEVKDRYHRLSGEPHPLSDRMMMASETLARLGSATAPLSNWMLRCRPFRYLLAWTLGVAPQRRFPPFQRKTLRHRFQPQPPTSPIQKIAFFADVAYMYQFPDRALRAIRYLETLGCEVSLPPQRGSGYPYVAYGDLNQARKVARYNIDHLFPIVETGGDIVALEPTAVYALRHTYSKLLPEDERAQILARHTYGLFEYLYDVLRYRPTSATLAGRRLGFHLACHQRGHGDGHAARTWLEAQGAKVVLIETGTCCGMGGTFGMKAGVLGYELAQAVGEPLFEQFRQAGVEAIVTESNVCSIHLEEGTGLPVKHPLEV